MRTLYQLLVVVLFYLWIGLQGCTLFKKTSKTTTKDQQSSTKQAESTQLIFKRADKETQVFTYWNDTAFYQFQNIREHIDEAKAGKLAMEQKQEVKQQSSFKISRPVKSWIYGVFAVMFVGCVLVCRRYLKTIFRDLNLRKRGR